MNDYKANYPITKQRHYIFVVPFREESTTQRKIIKILDIFFVYLTNQTRE